MADIGEDLFVFDYKSGADNLDLYLYCILDFSQNYATKYKPPTQPTPLFCKCAPQPKLQLTTYSHHPSRPPVTNRSCHFCMFLSRQLTTEAAKSFKNPKDCVYLVMPKAKTLFHIIFRKRNQETQKNAANDAFLKCMSSLFFKNYIRTEAVKNTVFRECIALLPLKIAMPPFFFGMNGRK